MNVFREIGNAVKKAAPLLGGLVSTGNPLATGLIAALTGNKSAQPSEILKYLQNNPDAISKLKEIEMQNEHDLALEDLKLDQTIVDGNFKVQEAQAKSSDYFVSRARPALMWVCTFTLLYAFILHPLLMLFTSKPPVVLSLPIEFWGTMSALFGMYTTARSFDKYQESKAK